MSQFIFTSRNGIHIIDLQKTMQRLKIAFNAMKEISAQGGKVLFVGTKKQAQAAIEEYANKCGMFYVAERWLGGLLTNYNTVSNSIQRLKSLEEMSETGNWDAETKKEILDLQRELAKKRKVLIGIKDMGKLPDALFIIDPKRESIAVNEAKKLGIPIFAVVDTNCDPDEIDYPIPGNDDAIRAIALFLNVISKSIIEGQSGGQADAVEDIEDEDIEDEDIEESEEEAGEDEGISTVDDENLKASEDATEDASDESVEEPAGSSSDVASQSDESDDDVGDAQLKSEQEKKEEYRKKYEDQYSPEE